MDCQLEVIMDNSIFDDYKYFWFGLIGSMVVFFLCCIVGVIWGKCKSDGGRNGGNARRTNPASRYHNHRGKTHGLHSNHVYAGTAVDTGSCGSYGGGFGGYSGGGCGSDSGGCGGDSGGCGGDAGACGV